MGDRKVKLSYAVIATVVITVASWAWQASANNSERRAEISIVRSDAAKLAAVVESVEADAKTADHERTQMRVDLGKMEVHLGWLVDEGKARIKAGR